MAQKQMKISVVESNAEKANTYRQIGEEAFSGCTSLTIHASASSYAEKYAKANRIPFEAI